MKKFDIFNRTILNIVSNFIPHLIIICDDKDPAWFTNRINRINSKDAAYKVYCHNRDNLDLIYCLQFLQEHFLLSLPKKGIRLR